MLWSIHQAAFGYLDIARPVSFGHASGVGYTVDLIAGRQDRRGHMPSGCAHPNDNEEMAVDATSSRTTLQVATWVGTAVLALAGVGIALSGCAGSPTGAKSPSVVSSVASPVVSVPPATTPSPKPSPSRHTPAGVTGQISAVNGSTWTVVNKAGKEFTVTITPQTQFGTRRQPATEQQFTVGSAVRVLGTITDNTVIATRVEAPPEPRPSAQSPVAPTTTTSGQ